MKHRLHYLPVNELIFLWSGLLLVNGDMGSVLGIYMGISLTACIKAHIKTSALLVSVTRPVQETVDRVTRQHTIPLLNCQSYCQTVNITTRAEFLELAHVCS